MATLEKLEFKLWGPCRFIGKSVYARAGALQSGEIFGHLWGISQSVFEKLDSMTEYLTTERNHVALLTGDKYDDKTQLLGYTVGRFMRADTPVPPMLDFFDIPQVYMAQGWVRGEFDDMVENANQVILEAMKQQNVYVPYECGPFFAAEVYSKDTIPQRGVDSIFGFYLPCKKK